MTDAEQLVNGYDGPLRPQVVELAESVVFMSRKLKETRESMGRTPLIVKYDNGGGQSGYRENPVFKAYNALNRSYLSALDQLARMTNSAPQATTQQAAQATPAGDSLDRMRRKFRAVSGGRAS